MGEGNQLVLVVEDAEDVRQLVHTVLERAGFGPLETVRGFGYRYRGMAA